MADIVLKNGTKSITLKRIEKSVKLKQQTKEITLKQIGLRGLPGTGDRTFVWPFTNMSTVDIVHDLAKFPSVSVVNSAGDKIEPAIKYISSSQVQLKFNGSFTGTAYLN